MSGWVGIKKRTKKSAMAICELPQITPPGGWLMRWSWAWPLGAIGSPQKRHSSILQFMIFFSSICHLFIAPSGRRRGWVVRSCCSSLLFFHLSSYPSRHGDGPRVADGGNANYHYSSSPQMSHGSPSSSSTIHSSSGVAPPSSRHATVLSSAFSMASANDVASTSVHADTVTVARSLYLFIVLLYCHRGIFLGRFRSNRALQYHHGGASRMD